MPRNRVPFLIAKILSGQRVCFRLSLRLLTPIVVVGAWLALPVGSVPAQADTVSQIWELNYISDDASRCPPPHVLRQPIVMWGHRVLRLPPSGTKSGGLTWVSQSVPTTSATVNGSRVQGTVHALLPWDRLRMVWQVAACGEPPTGLVGQARTFRLQSHSTMWRVRRRHLLCCRDLVECDRSRIGDHRWWINMDNTNGAARCWCSRRRGLHINARLHRRGGGFDRRDHQWRCDVDHPSTPHRHRWHSDLQQCGVRQLRYVLRRWVNKQRRRGRQDKRWWSLDQPDPSGGPRDFTRHRLSHGQGLHVCRGQSVEFLLDHRH